MTQPFWIGSCHTSHFGSSSCCSSSQAWPRPAGRLPCLIATGQLWESAVSPAESATLCTAHPPPQVRPPPPRPMQRGRGEGGVRATAESEERQGEADPRPPRPGRRGGQLSAARPRVQDELPPGEPGDPAGSVEEHLRPDGGPEALGAARPHTLVVQAPPAPVLAGPGKDAPFDDITKHAALQQFCSQDYQHPFFRCYSP